MRINYSFDQEMYTTMGATPWVPGAYMELQCRWIEHVRERFDKPKLFLYLSFLTGQLGLAQWVIHPSEGRGSGLMIELQTWGLHEAFPEMKWLARRLRPNDGQESMVKKRVAAKRAAQRQWVESNEEEKKSVLAWAKKKYPDMIPTLARMMAPGSGVDLVGTPDDEYKEWCRRMENFSKGRVISA